MLCGVDPHRHLTTTSQVEVAATRRALMRRDELREQELDALAGLIIARLSEALNKK